MNKQIESLGEIHSHTPRPNERVAYVPSPFDQPQPVAPRPKQPGFWDRIFSSRRTAIEMSNRLAAEAHEQAKQKWLLAREAHEVVEQSRRRFLEEEILGDREAMEAHLEAVLQGIVWPRETAVSLEVSDDRRRVTIDVDLPEIEQLPKKTAAVQARGFRLLIKEMSPTNVQKLYMRHVHGIGFRIVGESFAALPTIEEVSLSAYTQRPNKATGQISDHYLYSVRVERARWQEINFAALAEIDVVEALARFELRREMTKTGVFRPIEPFAALETSRT